MKYLLLKQKFDDLRAKKQQYDYKDFNYNYSEKQTLEAFLKKHEKEIKYIIANKLTYKAISEESNLKSFT